MTFSFRHVSPQHLKIKFIFLEHKDYLKQPKLLDWLLYQEGNGIRSREAGFKKKASVHKMEKILIILSQKESNSKPCIAGSFFKISPGTNYIISISQNVSFNNVFSVVVIWKVILGHQFSLCEPVEARSWVTAKTHVDVRVHESRTVNPDQPSKTLLLKTSHFHL